MRRRGASLVGILLLTGLLTMAGLLILDYGSQARQRVAILAYEVQAEAMARSGLRYAEAMIVHGRWREPMSYESPPLGRGERFRVHARAVPGGWVLESRGEVGSVTRTRTQRL